MKDVNLLTSNGVNVQQSLELFGDMEMYDETLTDFVDMVYEKLGNLDKYKESGDMPNYAIEVHSLKSDARYLGFTALADMCYESEMKSKASDAAFVNENHPKIFAEAKKMIAISETYLGKPLTEAMPGSEAAPAAAPVEQVVPESPAPVAPVAPVEAAPAATPEITFEVVTPAPMDPVMQAPQPQQVGIANMMDQAMQQQGISNDPIANQQIMPQQMPMDNTSRMDQMIMNQANAPQQPMQAQPQMMGPQPMYGQPMYGQPMYGQPMYGQPMYGQPQMMGAQPMYGQPMYGPVGIDPSMASYSQQMMGTQQPGVKEGTILVVDDSNLVANFVKKIFESRYDVMIANDGAKAIEILDQEEVRKTIKACLLDLNMPNVDGFAVLEHMKQQGYFVKMPVAVESGVEDMESIDRANQYPIIDILAKPFNERDVQRVIEKCLAAYF